MIDVLQGLVFFRLLSAPSQGLLRNMFVVQSMQRKESLPVEGNIVIIIHGVAVRVMESGRALVGRGHVLGCTSLLKGAYAYSEQVKIAVISKTELETFLQAEHGSYPARSEYYRAAAASVLDAKMREEADTTSTVASVIEEEAGGDIVQDIERVLKESKSHKIMDRCLHLLASLEADEACKLGQEGEEGYGGTNRYFRKVASRMGIEVTFVDLTNPNNVSGALRPNTKMVNLKNKKRTLIDY